MRNETRVSTVPVLQIRQLWRDTVLDARHQRPSQGAVRIGSRMGWRWRILGADMAGTGELGRHLLPWLAPAISEVLHVALDDFTADESSLRGDDSHVLFAFDEEAGWTLHPPEGWSHEGDLGDEAGLVLFYEELRFEAKVVEAADRTARTPWLLDPVLAGSMLFMGTAGAALALVVALSPPPAVTESIALDEPTIAHLLKLPPKVEKAKPIEKKTPRDQTDKVENERDTPINRPRRKTRQRPGGEDGKRAKDVAAAQQAGVFSGGGWDLLMGNEGLDPTLASAVGKLAARGDGGAGIGVGGLGDRRGGLGRGGGPGGLGDVNVFGSGTRPDGAFGLGGDGKPTGTIDHGGDQVVMLGSLDAALIDAEVRRNLSQIRYCYQRELSRDPNLGGKITMRFTIASDGSVSSAAAKHDSVHNDVVQQCITNRFLRMRFPEPKHGIVVVSYPFVFAPS